MVNLRGAPADIIAQALFNRAVVKSKCGDEDGALGGWARGEEPSDHVGMACLRVGVTARQGALPGVHLSWR